MNIPFSDKAIPPSSSAPEATVERQNLFLHPKQLNNGHQMTRVPCHQQHYRSISDSPKYVNTTGKALLAPNSPAPLLIPLGNSQFFSHYLSLFIFPLSTRWM